MDKFFFLILFIFLQFYSFSQSRNEFNTLILSDATNEINEHVSINNIHYFLLNVQDGKSGVYRNEIIQTDDDFAILNSLELSGFNEMIFEATLFFEIINNELVLLSNTELNNQNHLIAHKFSLGLDEHTIIDSLNINGSLFVNFAKNDIKKDFNDDGYIIFGNLLDITTNLFSSIHTLKIDNNFKFIDLKKINNDFKAIQETIVLDDSKQYVLFGWLPEIFLLDEDFNFLDTIPMAFSFTHNYCEELGSSSIECIGYRRTKNETAISKNDFEIIDNKISLIESVPLNFSDSIAVENSIHQLLCNRDSQGRLNIVYGENWTPDVQGIDGNNLYIKQIDENGNLLIDRKIDGKNGQFVITSLENCDSNLIISGFYYPEENTFESRFNFILRIDQNGDIILNTGSNFYPENNVIIYPNPTSNILYIDVGEIMALRQIDLYSIDGNLLHTYPKNTLNSIHQLDVSYLVSGIYVIHLISDEGLITSKFIKN